MKELIDMWNNVVFWRCLVAGYLFLYGGCFLLKQRSDRLRKSAESRAHLLEKVNYLLRDDVSTLELQRDALSEEIGRVMLHRNDLQQRYRAEEADREIKAENKRIRSEWGKRTAAKRWVKLKVAA